MSENGEIYTAGKNFYTAAGSDGIDKFHLWDSPPLGSVLFQSTMFTKHFWPAKEIVNYFWNLDTIQQLKVAILEWAGHAGVAIRMRAMSRRAGS